jgi:hypothetical protein
MRMRILRIVYSGTAPATIVRATGSKWKVR